jgi:predicted NUDIX family phosphoesterase
MNNPQIQSTKVQPSHLSEEILVVKRSILFNDTSAWSGINNQIFDECMQTIQKNSAFMPRSHAETNPAYKQIIPYVIFTVDQKIFVMQRKTTASEQRLAHKYSIGIGGHMRQEDLSSNNIFNWALREFEEEVNYSGAQEMSKIGILNDDTNDVGKVHLGMILLLKGSSDQISIKSEHKSGMLLTLDECKALYSQMESWSQTCIDFIEKMNLI